MQEMATSMITRLARTTQVYQNDIIAADALPLLTINLQSDSTDLKDSTVEALAQLAAGTRESPAVVSAQIRTAEALPALAAMLQPADSSWCGPKAAAIVVTLLASHSQQNRGSIVAAGIVPQLAALLSSDHRGLQNQAAAALGNIADGSQNN